MSSNLLGQDQHLVISSRQIQSWKISPTLMGSNLLGQDFQLFHPNQSDLFHQGGRRDSHAGHLGLSPLHLGDFPPHPASHPTFEHNLKNASGFPPRPPLPDASHRSVQLCGRICCRGVPLYVLFVPPNHVFPYPGIFVSWGLLTWPILLTAPILHLLLQVLLLLFQFPTEWRRQPDFKMQLVLQKHSHPFFWDVYKVLGFSGIALKTVWRAGVPCGHSALSRCHLPRILWVRERESTSNWTRKKATWTLVSIPLQAGLVLHHYAPRLPVATWCG